MDVNKNGRSKKCFIVTRMWALFVLGGAMLFMGQIQMANAEPAPEVTAVVEQVESAAEEAAMQEALTGQSIQTISFKKDMPIKDALRMLAQMYQKNIVPTAMVDGIVTVTNLYDVTFEEALQAILGTNKYEVKGNFIRVYTNEEYMQDKDRFEHAIITLYYVNSEEARKLAEPLLSEFGKMKVRISSFPPKEVRKHRIICIHYRSTKPCETIVVPIDIFMDSKISLLICLFSYFVSVVSLKAKAINARTTINSPFSSSFFPLWSMF